MTLVRLDGQFRGATWAPNGTIAFATSNNATGLQRIAAGGGEPTVLTRPDRARGEADHLWPEFELFYLAPSGALMRVGVARGATWSATVPAKLLEGRYYVGTATQFGRMWDIAPDGRRFLMIKPGAGSESTPAPTSLVVVQHFGEELKRLVPTK